MYQLENKLVDLKNANTHQVCLAETEGKNVAVDVLRLDKINPVLSGNKWFKLKFYLEEALMLGQDKVLTFGGAYSNHVVATAYAASNAGLSSIGIIRGEEPLRLSDTLKTASRYGMQLHYISRNDYNDKDSESFRAYLPTRFGDCYIIPEGGAGMKGIQGSKAILGLTAIEQYTHIISAIGTGTTFAGLASAALPEQDLIGVPVLKGLNNYLDQLLEDYISPGKRINCHFIYDYHFGGYAKKTAKLIGFMNAFYLQTGIPTDFVYTAKLFYALRDLVAADYFSPGSRILAIHSGGLQGNSSLPAGALLF